MPRSNMAELLRLDWKNGRQILNLVWISVEMGKLAYMQLSPNLLYSNKKYRKNVRNYSKCDFNPERILNKIFISLIVSSFYVKHD